MLHNKQTTGFELDGYKHTQNLTPSQFRGSLIFVCLLFQPCSSFDGCIT